MENKQSIQEGNKLIAEFMGLRWRMFDGRLLLSSDNGKSWYGKLFDKDWNTIMPVVEKINRMKGFDVIIYKTTVHINDEQEIMIETTGNIIIEAVWRAIVQFVKYYNSEHGR